MERGPRRRAGAPPTRLLLAGVAGLVVAVVGCLDPGDMSRPLIVLGCTLTLGAAGAFAFHLLAHRLERHR